MTRTLAMTASAILLLAGTQIGHARDYGSCGREAAAARQECFASSGRDRARAAECSSLYRDDVRECGRFGRDRDRRW